MADARLQRRFRGLAGFDERHSGRVLTQCAAALFFVRGDHRRCEHCNRTLARR